MSLSFPARFTDGLCVLGSAAYILVYDVTDCDETFLQDLNQRLQQVQWARRGDDAPHIVVVGNKTDVPGFEHLRHIPPLVPSNCWATQQCSPCGEEDTPVPTPPKERKCAIQ